MNRLTVAENYYYQYREGAMSVEQWTRMVETLKAFMRTPGGQSWWGSSRIRPNVPFERFLDEEVNRIQSSPANQAENAGRRRTR